MSKFKFQCSVFLLVIAVAAVFQGCSSSRPLVKKQAYAELKSERLFEVGPPGSPDFGKVWKAIEHVFRHHRVTRREPSDVSPVQMKSIPNRQLSTDWIYSRSRDQYQEYRVNDSPRKVYLQTRIRYEVLAERALGGVQVRIQSEEEIERLGPDGASLGYDPAERPDTSRTHEILDQVDQAILAAPPIESQN